VTWQRSQGDWLNACHSPGLSAVFVFGFNCCQIKLFIFTSFSMGMHSGSGGQENTVKTHKNGELNFHLKGGSRPGPTKQSGAFPAEGSHREASLAQKVMRFNGMK